jgi:TetR/AcrR family transcriptional repressor of mexJK operon
LLDAALDEFIVHGFSGASIETIASTAGVGKSTIYRNYETKQGLLLAVASRRMRELGTRWSNLRFDIDDPEGTLYRIALMSYNEWSGKSLPIYRIIYTEAARLPDLARAVHDLTLTEAIWPVSAYFQQLQDRGYISVKNVAETASMFLTTAVGGARFLMVPSLLDDDARERLARDAVQSFLFGCATPQLPKQST